MDGWVGHVGWPIADGLTAKWSPIQLVWHRIGKVCRPRPAFWPLCYAAKVTRLHWMQPVESCVRMHYNLQDRRRSRDGDEFLSPVWQIDRQTEGKTYRKHSTPTMGLPLTVSEKNGDFSGKSHFSYHVFLAFPFVLSSVIGDNRRHENSILPVIAATRVNPRLMNKCCW